MLVALIASRTVFQENIIVACSRKLMAIRSGDLVFRHLRVLFLMTEGHGTQYQNLSSGQHSLHPVRHVSHGTV